MAELASAWMGKLRRFIASKDKSTYVDKFLWRRRSPAAPAQALTYADRARSERDRFSEVLDVNALPDIFHYWSNTHLRPIFEDFGIDHSDDWFASHFLECAAHDGDSPSLFASIGSGNCDTEVRVAKLLRQRGLQRFNIECLDMNAAMLARGRQLAQAEGVGDCLTFTETDLNDWHAPCLYTAVMANQSLHHVVGLEHLLAEVKFALRAQGAFVVSDIIGRNGHMRWPEALEALQRFWAELPDAQRYNHQMRRDEHAFVNWDCSGEGFEGIRAQDILPLLVQRFHFRKFIGFGNVIDPFVDRSFGHNFDPASPRDRAFIDRIHAFDERGLADGSLTPTHMFAVMVAAEPQQRQFARGLSPERSLRPASADDASRPSGRGARST